MAQYGFWKAIPMSFYSRDLYRDVAKNWDSDIVLYLLILLTLCWIPFTIITQQAISRKAPGFVNSLAVQVPTIDIKDGVASTPENRPYLIKDTKQENVIAIIDTSGQHTSLENEPDNVQYMLTKTEWMSRDNDSTIKVRKLSPTLDTTIKPSVISDKILDWINWLWLLAFPFLLVGSLMYRLVLALFYAGIGKIFVLSTDREMSYEVLLRLAIVAMTPAIVLNTIMPLFNIHMAFISLLYFVIAIGYLIFAIRVNQPKS